MLFLAFRFDIFRVLCVQKIASENQVFNKYSVGTCLLILLDLSIFSISESWPLPLEISSSFGFYDTSGSHHISLVPPWSLLLDLYLCLVVKFWHSPWLCPSTYSYLTHYSWAISPISFTSATISISPTNSPSRTSYLYIQMLLNIFIWMSHGYLKINMSKGPYDLLPLCSSSYMFFISVKAPLSTKLHKQETQMLLKITLSLSLIISSQYLYTGDFQIFPYLCSHWFITSKGKFHRHLKVNIFQI